MPSMFREKPIEYKYVGGDVGSYATSAKGKKAVKKALKKQVVKKYKAAQKEKKKRERAKVKRRKAILRGATRGIKATTRKGQRWARRSGRPKVLLEP